MKRKPRSRLSIHTVLLTSGFFYTSIIIAQVPDSSAKNSDSLLLKQTGTQRTADSTAADSALLKQIEAQMQADTTQQPNAAQPRSSLSFNPDIGVIGDFQAAYTSQGKKN